MGKSLSKDFLKNELSKIWNWAGPLELMAIGKGFYIVVCPNSQKKSELLADGPWFALGSHIWLQPWKPSFEPSKVTINQKQIWVHMPKIPIEFLQKQMLMKIGKSIVKVLKIDTNSIEGDRRRYASLCLWVNASRKLPEGLWLRKHHQHVRYTVGPGFCNLCFAFGHHPKTCQKSPITHALE